MVHPQSVDALSRVGGALCLDFVNTMGWRVTPEPTEWLTTYNDLVRWGCLAGIFTEEDMKKLLNLTIERPVMATQALGKARSLRQSLYHIFSALAHCRRPEEPDIDLINGMLPDTLGRLQLVSATDGFEWQWHQDTLTFDSILRPVIRSAAELLTSPQVKRVKECANQGCGWVFLDTSKNHSRRWCDMRECGNRTKARRHYRKAKDGDKSKMQGTQSRRRERGGN